MRPTLSSFSIALYFSIAILTVNAAESVVRQTCKVSSEKNRNINFDFCLRSFQAVPVSGSADLFQLGAISLGLIKRDVSRTSRHIESLLKNASEKASVKSALNDCQEVYSGTGDSLREVSRAYMKKLYGEANVKLSSVMDAFTTCEDGLKEVNGGASPLTERNDNAFQLTAIALSIMNMNLNP